MTIAFMGLDGTGKSTQAERLRHVQSESGRTWTVLHHSSTRVPGIAQVKRRFHAPLIRVLKKRRAHVTGESERDRQPDGRRILGWSLSLYLVAGSLIKAYWYRLRFAKRRLILDRCLIDDLVKVEWRFGCRLPGTGSILRIAPKPELTLVLEGDPATMYARKKAPTCTYPEYLRKQKILDAYLDEAAASGWTIRRVDIDRRPIEEVHRVIRHILDGSDALVGS